MKIASINNIHNTYKKSDIKNITFHKKEAIEDKVEINASNDGKFSKKEAGKNFIKGVFSPLKAIVEHPLISLSTVALTGVACSLVPVIAPVMSIGFGAVSIFQLGKGVFNSINEYKKGNYDNSEKAFETIGQGTIGTATSLMSVKRNSRIVEEAYAMKGLEKTKLSFRERTKISDKVNDRSYLKSLKVLFSMFTTKMGRRTFLAQFKPFMVRQRAKDFISSLNPTNKKTDIIKTYDKKMYAKTAEGKRRALMSDADIEKEVRLTFDKIFDELGVEKEYRPELIVTKMNNAVAGSYYPSRHSLLYNTNSYRQGLGDIDEVLMHEATHCKRSLLRTGLSKAEVEKTVKSVLRGKILNGDVDEVIYADSKLLPKTVETPLMNPKMRFDFLKLAEQDLFVEDDALNKGLLNYQHQHSLAMTKSGYANPTKLQKAETEVLPFLEKIKGILDKYPDFVAQYDSYDDALDILLKYSISQNYRYNYSLAYNVGNGIKYPISPSQIDYSKQIVKEQLNSTDSNKVIMKSLGRFVDKKAYNQYQFSEEEVAAHQNAMKFALKNLTDELAVGKKNGLLSQERELYLNNQIKKTSLILEQRTKGLEYCKNYTRSRNNPNNSALKTLVEQQEQELDSLMKQINALRPQYKEKVVSYSDKMTTISPLNILAMLSNKTSSKKEEQKV